MGQVRQDPTIRDSAASTAKFHHAGCDVSEKSTEAVEDHQSLIQGAPEEEEAVRRGELTVEVITLESDLEDCEEQLPAVTATCSNSAPSPDTRRSNSQLQCGIQQWFPRRLSSNSFKNVESFVDSCYDRTFAGEFFSFFYDVLQMSSGRDKLCAFFQNLAQFASAALVEKDSERYWVFRGLEDSLSDGRKVFRLFKEQREVYKIRRGLDRLDAGIKGSGACSSAALCGSFDVLAHVASFWYYLFDNMLWCASVGILRTKKVPKWQRGIWEGMRRNGAVVSFFGGVSGIKRAKNLASIWRLVFALGGNTILLWQAWKARRPGSGWFTGAEDPVLNFGLELLGMLASFRVLASKLGLRHSSHANLAVLGMLAAACGMWRNLRKVRRKNCGSKRFSISAM